MLGVLAVAGAVSPFEGRDHFVHIAWQEDDGDGAVWFEVAKGRYSALLAELEAVTVQKPLDLTTEREQKLRELQDKAERLDIILDREVWVAGKTLQPGHYDLVLLEITETIGELYFFRVKKVKPKHPETGAVVEILKQANKISYYKVNGVFT